MTVRRRGRRNPRTGAARRDRPLHKKERGGRDDGGENSGPPPRPGRGKRQDGPYTDDELSSVDCKLSRRLSARSAKAAASRRTPRGIPSGRVASNSLPFYPECSIAMKRIYLDHNATTPVEPSVLEAMLPFFSGDFGNASSIHTFGQRARAAVETAREQVAALLNARPQEIVFTSGGTESDNHAIFGVFASAAGAATSSTAIPHIITSSIDHEAVLEAIRPDTILIALMHANNELGTVQPLAEFGRIAAEADVYFHTDAVQSVGKIPVDVKALQLDLLSLSGHKLYAPKGVGALFIKGGTRLRQFLYGGHHQRGFRPGTENVAGIVGLGKAAELARLSLQSDASRIAALRDRLEQGLLARVPDAQANAASAPRTPNTCNITFPGIEGEALIIALDLKGLACSTGAACSSGAVEPSHVLTAIGLSAPEARATIRFSLGRYTTESEIDAALEIVPAAVAQLRQLSPTYRREVSA